MQDHPSTAAPAPARIFLKLAAWPVANPSYLSPTLHVGHCIQCGADILRCELRAHAGLFVQTTEPTMPWIKIAIPLSEFIEATGVSRVHACGHGSSGVTQ